MNRQIIKADTYREIMNMTDNIGQIIKTDNEQTDNIDMIMQDR